MENDFHTKDFTQLKRNLKKDFSNLPSIKIALLGDTATQFLNQALRGLAYDYQLNLDIWEADINQIERQVFDTSSELFQQNPSIVILFQSTNKLLGKYNKLSPAWRNHFAENELDLVQNICASISSGLHSKIIYFNYPEIDDSVFGNYANKVESSFLFQLRKLNFELMVAASKNSNLFLCDISSIQNQIGKSVLFQPTIYFNADMVLSIDALPVIAKKTMDIISALSGNFKKCIILDLDNTIWGGVIGDDGMENIQIGNLGIGKAFSEFQYWIKKLIQRGIIVAVCSKNTESIAKEPFDNHPDMVLRLNDIAIFMANWDDKYTNINKIKNILNIGFDSMVFIDDNPFERNIVKQNIPQICVPELPEDPADFLEFLYNLNLFETVSFSNEDEARNKQYQVEVERMEIQQKFTNNEDFLASLQMISKVEPFNNFNTPRVAQLSQRSNQFNVRTVRYSESEISKISNSNEFITLSFTLEDKFGDNGLISSIILKKENKKILFIENWMMSCRVLKRSMEEFVLNSIVETALQNGFKLIKGEYLPTPKNELVKNLYFNLGFKEENKCMILDLSKYEVKSTFIQKK